MVALSSCSESWQLMPAPLAHQYLGGEAFREVSSEDRSPEIRTFYATNRPPADRDEKRYYGNGATSDLRLGMATVRMGEPGLHWQDVLDISAAAERKDEVPLDLESAEELDSLPATTGAQFAAEIERVLRRSRFKEITLFVHGAKSNFLRSTVQGAQFLIAFAFALFVIFRLMGRDYEAAVICSGFGGISLGSTPTAMANMTAVSKRYGAAHKAFIIVPLVCGFFVDIANAVIIKTFLTWFG